MPSCLVLKAEKGKLDGASFEKISESIKNGGVIGYPTDTFYALGTDPRNAESVEKVYSIKGRVRRKPLLCIISELEGVMKLAADIPPAFGLLSEKFWPGPLTIIFKASSDLPEGVLSPNGTIGLRLPAAELPRKIAAICGTFITATSANRSGELPPESGDIVKRDIGGEIDLLVDTGTIGDGKISSIIDISQETPRFVREGTIAKEEIEGVLNLTL